MAVQEYPSHLIYTMTADLCRSYIGVMCLDKVFCSNSLVKSDRLSVVITPTER